MSEVNLADFLLVPVTMLRSVEKPLPIFLCCKCKKAFTATIPMTKTIGNKSGILPEAVAISCECQTLCYLLESHMKLKNRDEELKN